MATGSERRPFGTTLTQTQVDEGLRKYMLRVYNYMGSGLALTGIVAYVVAHTGLYQALYGSVIGFIVMLAPLGIVFFMGAKIKTMKPSTAQTLFWVFSVLMGASLSYVFLTYTATSIVRVFFITAATFGAMSLYGYTTKRSLARWGSFLFMGLIGVIIAMVVNIFMQSEFLYYAISVIGVLVFTGLTAYDTQRIKESYVESDGQAVMTKKAIMGALNLYLNFINLFLMLLHLFGGRE
ncbi:MAG: Bax inhibitor-1/YccA family protein [Alphaproteobacteria bacterium]|nr:Bax inhibitor-1/YccA family protein [Alphaproteobacteria bacterium]|tara:strand:- start:40 stop:750 length:711 start_codon:yes stop_codon:yes gene_type:complete